MEAEPSAPRPRRPWVEFNPQVKTADSGPASVPPRNAGGHSRVQYGSRCKSRGGRRRRLTSNCCRVTPPGSYPTDSLALEGVDPPRLLGPQGRLAEPERAVACRVHRPSVWEPRRRGCSTAFESASIVPRTRELVARRFRARAGIPCEGRSGDGYFPPGELGTSPHPVSSVKKDAGEEEVPGSPGLRYRARLKRSRLLASRGRPQERSIRCFDGPFRSSSGSSVWRRVLSRYDGPGIDHRFSPSQNIRARPRILVPCKGHWESAWKSRRQRVLTVESESKRPAAAVVDQSPARRDERVVDLERAQDLVNLAAVQRLSVFLRAQGETCAGTEIARVECKKSSRTGQATFGRTELPHVQTCPLSVTSADVSAPALMRATPPPRPVTSRGRSSLVKPGTSRSASPRPSWPSVLQPVPYTSPASVRSKACSNPT